jgi:hypothetical protein
MFEDPKSRRSFRLFKLRAELMLSGVARTVRRRLMEDLTAHLIELVEHADPSLSESVRVDAAITRIGDPREFLAPLVADAVLSAQARRTGWRAVAYAAIRGGRRLGEAVSIALSFVIGAMLAIAAAGAVILPERIGLFHFSGDEYQLRLFGLSGSAGTPVFHPWFSLLGLIIGAALIFVAWRGSRRLAAEILAGEYENPSQDLNQPKE